MKTFKKFLVLTLVLIVVASQVTSAAFIDVGSDHDYATSIDWMSDNGVIVGYGDGSFSPEQCVNRVELLKMLFEMLEVDETVSNYQLFPDTPSDQWYAPYVRTARERGSVVGYEDGNFRPAQCVNRVEAIKMAVLEFNNGSVPSYPELPSPVQDAEVGAWYTSYLNYALYVNSLGRSHTEALSNGFNFFPGESMSRAEVAEMLYRTKTIADNSLEVYSNDYVPEPILVEAIIFHDINAYGNDTAMPDYKQALLDAYNLQYNYKTPLVWDDIDWLFEWYGVGTINVAPYAGWELRVLDLQCDGMCMNTNLYRFAYNDGTGELVLLQNHSYQDYVPDYFAPLTANQDSATTLYGLDLPETITSASGGLFTRVTKDSNYQPDNLGFTAFVDPVVGNVYYADASLEITCLYVVSPDGSSSTYAYDPILLMEGVTMEVDGVVYSISDNYAAKHRGCGISGCFYEEDVASGDLTLVGTTNSDVELYEVTDAFEGATTSLGDSNAQEMVADTYQTYFDLFDMMPGNEGLTPMNFQEYLDSYPVLFFQDPLYRWSAVLHNDVRPPAECGKPVIYLYPEETMDVHVEVDIDEFTVTIPEYGENGWTVKASPDGTLYNYEDCTEYPYLFWEGYKKDGIDVNSGFMVEREEVEPFLLKSLAEMGLNESETADFMEFWLVRMLDNPQPYFHISFVGTQDFNKVAPLTIEPAPDTLIRVFMYYSPVKRPYALEPQELKAIDRNGFTVIEWGGTSSMPWKN